MNKSEPVISHLHHWRTFHCLRSQETMHLWPSLSMLTTPCLPSAAALCPKPILVCRLLVAFHADFHYDDVSRCHHGESEGIEAAAKGQAVILEIVTIVYFCPFHTINTKCTIRRYNYSIPKPTVSSTAITSLSNSCKLQK